MEYYSIKTFYANDTIFREGSSGHCAYILKTGTVEISVEDEGRRTVLGLLKPVTVFGEMALLLKNHRRIATATAREYAELVEITRKSFEEFLGSSPTFIRMILTTMAERLGEANSRVMALPDPFVALCQMLDLLFASQGAAVSSERVVKALAEALSVEPAVVHGALESLEKYGLIAQAAAAGGVTLRPATPRFLERALAIRRVAPSEGTAQPPDGKPTVP